MRDDVRNALLKSFDIREQSAELQIKRGVVDTGLRSQVTAGRHLNPITEVIVSDLRSMGISDDCIYDNQTNLPGWFRVSKQWDLLAFHEDRLIAAIELKSICSSYGNNLNNRAEEAIGESVDAKYAIQKGLIGQTIPPLLCYALIVKKEKKSTTICKASRKSHFPLDPVYVNTSYIDKFKILCQRMRREGLFGAVWFVTVDPIDGIVEEPDPDLTYEKFIAEIRGKASVFLMN